MSSIKGHIITNSFLRTDKFARHYEWLKESAGKYGVDLLMFENADVLCGYSCSNESRLSELLDGDSFLIYWDKDIRIGRQIENICSRKNILLCNSVESIAVCDDKSETYSRLWQWNLNNQKNQIPLVPTLVAPMTYLNIGYTNTDFLDDVIEELSLPVVVKECFGSFGMQVYLAETKDELKDIVLKLGGTPHIYQKFIEKSSGKDVRLQVVGDKVVAAMYRYSVNGDFRANVTNGAHMKPYKPSDDECELAVRTAKILGLDFGGIDMLFSDGNGRADLICEVNSNAHFKNIFDCTGVNVADEIMDYIIRKIKVHGGDFK